MLSTQNSFQKGITQRGLMFVTALIGMLALVMAGILIWRMQNTTKIPLKHSVIPSISTTPTRPPQMRFSNSTYVSMFKSKNFPIEVILPEEFGKANVFETDYPQAKGPLNVNGVMQQITFEKSPVRVGIMMKQMNEPFVIEKEKFTYGSKNKFEVEVDQHIVPSGPVNPDLLMYYNSLEGTYFVVARYYVGKTLYLTVTYPNSNDKDLAINTVKRMIDGITLSLKV